MKVIGLTGTIGAGKKMVKSFIKEKVDSYDIVLSDIIFAEIERKRGKADRTTLQNMGNEMRRLYGGHILAKLAVEYLSKRKSVVVIDGIRNMGEIEFLKKKFGDDFKLIAVDADQKTRFERISKRAQPKDPRTWEEFLANDERDQGNNEPEYGQQVRACISQADFTIKNDGDEATLKQQVEDVLSRILTGP